MSGREGGVAPVQLVLQGEAQKPEGLGTPSEGGGPSREEGVEGPQHLEEEEEQEEAAEGSKLFWEVRGFRQAGRKKFWPVATLACLCPRTDPWSRLCFPLPKLFPPGCSGPVKQAGGCFPYSALDFNRGARSLEDTGRATIPGC